MADKFQYVKQRVPIVDILEWYGWDGQEFSHGWNGYITIRCPFHPDNNPSARYNPDKDRFDCYACDIHGDIFDVVSAVDFKPVKEAREWIEETFLN